VTSRGLRLAPESKEKPRFAGASLPNRLVRRKLRGRCSLFFGSYAPQSPNRKKLTILPLACAGFSCSIHQISSVVFVAMAFKKMFFTTKRRRLRRNKEKPSFSSSLRGFIFLESYSRKPLPRNSDGIKPFR
jgi:hypothetical protein